MTTQQGQPLDIPPLKWDENIGKGLYANTVHILASLSEVTLDFSFRTAAIAGKDQPLRGAHLHVARIILNSQTSRELRDLLVRNIKDT